MAGHSHIALIGKTPAVIRQLAVARNTRDPACSCADCNVHDRLLTSLSTGIALANMWGTLGLLTASALELGTI